MLKKIVVISMALLLVLSFTACNGALSEEEIIGKSVQAMRDVSSYRADMNFGIDIAMEDESGMYNLAMVSIINGAYDLENEKMMLDMLLEVSMFGMTINAPGKAYLIDSMMYTMVGDEGSGYMWAKTEMPGGYWEEVDQMESQVDMLEAVQVEITGSGMVEGIECYIIELTPDMEKLWQLVMQQANLTGEEMLPEIDIELYQDIFKDFYMKQWIAKDTYYITKAEVGIAMEMIAEDLGSTEEEGAMTASITLDVLAYDYNQPVTIELPVEAEEAELVDIY